MGAGNNVCDNVIFFLTKLMGSMATTLQDYPIEKRYEHIMET